MLRRSRASARQGCGSFKLRRGNGEGSGATTEAPSSDGSLDQRRSQRLLASEPVQGWGAASTRRCGATAATTSCECLDRRARHRAASETPRDRADRSRPRAEACPVCGSVDDAAHFEPAHLADQHAVLDRRRGAAVDDQRAELLVLGTAPPGGDGKGSAIAGSSIRSSTCHTSIGKRKLVARRARIPVPSSASTCRSIDSGTHRPCERMDRGRIAAARRATPNRCRRWLPRRRVRTAPARRSGLAVVIADQRRRASR